MTLCCVCNLEIDLIKYYDPKGIIGTVSRDIATMKPRVIYAHRSCAERAANTFNDSVVKK